MNLKIPHNLIIRPYQIPIWRAIDSGIKRIIQVWHRRAGKDITDWNILIKKGLEEVGTYYYFFPTYEQGRKALWEAIGNDGMRFTDYIPEQLIYSKNDQQMKLVLRDIRDPNKPGSVIRIIGTDDWDSIMGTNPRGVIFSEYSLQNPAVWSFIRPILLANGGWAIFNFTPRGENHAFDLLKLALDDPTWFVSMLNADQTGVFTKEALEQEKKEYIALNGDDLLFQQEYYNSFQAGNKGSYFFKWLVDLQGAGRINNLVKFDPKLPVITSWDIGVDDHTSIWFAQAVRKELRIIDYYQNHGVGLNHYSDLLNEKTQKFGYRYGLHIAPHDMSVREFANDGRTRVEIAEEDYGITFEVLPKTNVADRIAAVRKFLPMCYFHDEKTREGRNALKSYHTAFDEKKKVYKDHPEHDWASHPSDSFGYLIQGFEFFKEKVEYTPEEIMEELSERQRKNQHGIYDIHRLEIENYGKEEYTPGW